MFEFLNNYIQGKSKIKKNPFDQMNKKMEQKWDELQA